MTTPTVLTVTFSRSGTDLAVTNHPGDDLVGIWLEEDGIDWPSFTMRNGYAPDSNLIGGRSILSTVSNGGQTTLRLKFKAATFTALVALMDDFEATTAQITYDLTIAFDGFTRTWPAFSELPQWGTFSSGPANAKLMTASIVIPLNPRS